MWILRVLEVPGRDIFRRPMKSGVGTLEKDLTRAGGGGGQGNGAADPPTSLMPDANMHAESLYFNFFGQSGVYSILYSMDF